MHRVYFRDQARHPDNRGRPPRPLSDARWARVEESAARAVGSLLDQLLGAIRKWTELSSNLKRSDLFGDGDRVGRCIASLLIKLGQYGRVCNRCDRPWARSTAALADLLRVAQASHWPSGMTQDLVDDLGLFQKRAFPFTKTCLPSPEEIRTRLEFGVTLAIRHEGMKQSALPVPSAIEGSAMANSSCTLPPIEYSASNDQKSERKRWEPDELRAAITSACERLSQEGIKITDRAVAKEVGCSASAVNGYIQETRRIGSKRVLRGFKTGDGHFEAY